MAKSLWEPPRLRTVGDEEEERRVTWLELFYDLVFVVAIAQVAHNLTEHVSLSGFLGFIVLFVPIWWSWVGATFYATRFDTDDLGHRLLTLLQMVGVAVMAVNVHHGLDKSSAAFALSYVGVRTVLILQYQIAGHFVPPARPLTNWYSRGFGIAALLWLSSAFVPLPWRFALWALGIIVDLSTPLTVGKLASQIPPSTSHIPERLGLFTIIVLGESVASVVRGVAELEWGVSSASAAVLGMTIAFSLWWIYFDSVDGSPLKAMRKGYIRLGMIWLYAHLPLAIGLVATGVGVEHLVASQSGVVPPAERWLICTGVAMSLISLGVIHLITCTLGTTRRRKILAAYRFGAASFILVLPATVAGITPVMLVALIAIACIPQVFLDLLDNQRLSEI